MVGQRARFEELEDKDGIGFFQHGFYAIVTLILEMKYNWVCGVSKFMFE